MKNGISCSGISELSASGRIPKLFHANSYGPVPNFSFTPAGCCWFLALIPCRVLALCVPLRPRPSDRKNICGDDIRYHVLLAHCSQPFCPSCLLISCRNPPDPCVGILFLHNFPHHGTPFANGLKPILNI